MTPKYRIPTLLGLLFLVAAVAGGVLLVQQRQIFHLDASPDIAPREVRITNVTENRFSVSWITDKATLGSAAYGTSPSLGMTATDDQDKDSPQARITHHITVSDLTPTTLYFFKISSGERTFDRDGRPWQQVTALKLPAPPAEVIAGSVQSQSGEAVRGAIVYVTLPGASPLSTITNQRGYFSLSLAHTLTNDMAGFLPRDKMTTIFVFVQAGDGQITSAQVLLANAKPIPPLILGQTHDFRTPTQKELISPKSTIQLAKTILELSPSPTLASTPFPISSPTLTAKVTKTKSSPITTLIAHNPDLTMLILVFILGTVLAWGLYYRERWRKYPKL